MMKVLKDAKVLKYSSDQLMEIELVVAKYEKVDNFCTDALARRWTESCLSRASRTPRPSTTPPKSSTTSLRPSSSRRREFVTKELEVAKEESDEKRVTHRTIRLLQIDLDENGSQWSNIQRYPKLKSPEDYAKAKMFGKAKLRDTFYVSNGKSVVIGSLQQSDDKAFKKQAIQFNKWILGYSGDKKAPEGPEQSLINLLGAVVFLLKRLGTRRGLSCSSSSTPLSTRPLRTRTKHGRPLLCAADTSNRARSSRSGS